MLIKLNKCIKRVDNKGRKSYYLLEVKEGRYKHEDHKEDAYRSGQADQRRNKKHQEKDISHGNKKSLQQTVRHQAAVHMVRKGIQNGKKNERYRVYILRKKSDCRKK